MVADSRITRSSSAVEVAMDEEPSLIVDVDVDEDDGGTAWTWICAVATTSDTATSTAPSPIGVHRPNCERRAWRTGFSIT